MKRFKHSLSHYKLLTCDMAELVPVQWHEVLPGDTEQGSTSILLRVSPMLAPVMHPVSVRIHHWFVPYRLLWSEWENFITGGTDGLGNGAVYPTIGLVNPAEGSLADYLGVRPGTYTAPLSALPFRAYARIFNENYRDEDLTTALVQSSAGGVDTTTNTALQKIAWEKDRFTAARPWTQKGPAVTLPIGGQATVKTNSSDLVTTGTNPGVNFRRTSDNSAPPANRAVFSGAGGTLGVSGTAEAAVNSVYPSNLYADLGTSTSVAINDVRRAFALQRYQEARAQYGSRYTEYLRYLGVRSSDARLQRPEYLGGGKQTISFSEVLQTGVTTSGTPNIGVAELKGHGISALRSRRYRRFFEEHGIVMTLMSVRPRSMYVTGLHKAWSRRTKEDFWQKELELIGQEQVYRRELFCEADAGGAGGDTVFGWSDRYSDYRHLPSNVSGEFRSTLNFWHLGRIFASGPTLNDTFVKCDPSKRIHMVQSADVLWCMVSHSIQSRRMVTRNTIGRVL